MITKVLKKKDRPNVFGSTIQYMFRDSAADTAVFTQNLFSEDPELATKEFEENSKFLPARKNGNVAYHCVLSLPKCEVPDARQIVMLHSIMNFFVKRVYPESLAIGVCHTDSEFIHAHVLVSSNGVRNRTRSHMSRASFSKALRETEQYQISHFPMLGDKLLRKESREKKDQLQLSNVEVELKKRTKAPSQKEIRRTEILSIFYKVRSEADLITQLKGVDLVLYTRGKQQGVECQRTQRRYRLSTLGLAAEYLTAQKRQALYQSRLNDISKIQRSSPNRERS